MRLLSSGSCSRASKKPLPGSKPFGLAAQGHAQVEAEAVDVEFGGPVAQRVHRHADHLLMVEVEGVAAAGIVDVAARVLVGQAVVDAVVQAAQRQGGSQLVALAAVVVDHVQDHLDVGGVELLHSPLDLRQGAVREVGRLRGEPGQGVVAPVVGQTLFNQVAIAREGMDGQQLHRGDAQGAQVVDAVRTAEGAEGAALPLRALPR